MATATFKIILIFGRRLWAAGLAHVHGHRVAGIALSPADASIALSPLVFHKYASLVLRGS